MCERKKKERELSQERNGFVVSRSIMTKMRCCFWFVPEPRRPITVNSSSIWVFYCVTDTLHSLYSFWDRFPENLTNLITLFTNSAIKFIYGHIITLLPTQEFEIDARNGKAAAHSVHTWKITEMNDRNRNAISSQFLFDWNAAYTFTQDSYMNTYVFTNITLTNNTHRWWNEKKTMSKQQQQARSLQKKQRSSWRRTTIRTSTFNTWTITFCCF